MDGYVQTQYDLVCYTAANVRTEFGNLVLSTRTESVTCTAPTGVPPPAPPTTPKPFSYTSGWVDTFGKLVTTTSGLFEVRAKLPQPDFKIWPAAWLLSARNDRDRGGETSTESEDTRLAPHQPSHAPFLSSLLARGGRNRCVRGSC